MPEQYLFVYGSMRRGTGIPQQRLLRSHAELIGEARIKAIMFDLGRYPGIVLTTNKSSIVTGELYRIRHHRLHELLTQLDEYEECSDTFEEPHEFRRDLVKARLSRNAQEYRAWVYVYNRDISHCDRIPSGDYFRR